MHKELQAWPKPGKCPPCPGSPKKRNPKMATDTINKADLPSETPPPATRLLSLDALRGFDMFWIVGAEGGC